MIKAVFECVGMSYHLDALEEMKEINEDFSLTKKEIEEAYDEDPVYKYDFTGDLTVEQEPTNEADPNAVRVAYMGNTVAYIKKEEAQKVAELLLAGYRYKASASGGAYKVVEDGKIVSGEDPISVTVVFYDDDEKAAVPEAQKRPKTLLMILGVLLIVMSLLLLIVSPIAGIAGVVFGVLLIIYGRKK